RQILPGSFEYSLSYLIDTELDLSAFEQHYNNDEHGRPAYDPRLLLKIVILAYSKGITNSRQIDKLRQVSRKIKHFLRGKRAKGQKGS
ncbi:MAG: transposase, partial [Porticoccaceae bacterium]